MSRGETLLEDHTNSDEEDESLSLSDLPITQQEETLTIINKNPTSLEEAASHQDFEFGSMGGSILTGPELCAADDVFFQGQILPLRFSVSSDNGLSCRNPSRCGSRSDSMEEHCSSSTGFTSLSSRSSSIKSDHQSSSTTTTTTTSASSISTTTYYKPKLLKNNFHSHPSPKPQIILKNSGSKSSRNHVHRIGKSTTWGLFRVGLVRTPEIELQDLKFRNSNKSFSSTSSSSSNGGSKRFEEKKKKKKKKTTKMQRFLFESCKCSVDAIESVSSRNVVINKSINGGGSVNKKKSSSDREITKGGEVMKEEVEEEEEEKQGKQKALNHRRTFEWLKELSIGDVPAEEA